VTTERGADPTDLAASLASDLDALQRARRELDRGLSVDEIGTVTSIGSGIADVSGLPSVTVDELVRFDGGELGMAADLAEERVGVVLLEAGDRIAAGSLVRRTGRVLDVPVGEALLGRVVNPLGAPLDGDGELRTATRLPIERPAPSILERSQVSRPLQTGIKVVDALFPIGRGQRELIVGDRQTGKTSVALSTILAQRDSGVVCIYCSIGQRGSAVAGVVDTLRRSGALGYTIVVAASSHEPPGMRQIAPYAAMSIGEAFMEEGRDALVVFDDLVQHARAYRELSLLLRRPPGREAYPGDVFYLHARLLERGTQLSPARGGGSLTVLPVVETQEGNMSAYIPTNLISITDGQIVLSPDLAARGILPAVEVGRSVSRVGGKAQRPAYRSVAGRLRLAYAQFEELERFARFGSDIDESTRRTLHRGRRVREAFKQGAHETIGVCEQLAVLLAVSEGVFDAIEVEGVAAAERGLRQAVRREHHAICERIQAGDELDAADRERLLDAARQVAAAATGQAPPT
jgi:F-type H+/Na+-transporting ATPase subunit alpha